MHEVAIACALFDTVSAQAARFPRERVVGVTLSIGGLQALEPHAIRTCFALLAEGTNVAGAELVVERQAVRVFCRSCDGEHTADTRFHCRACGGDQVRLLPSRGMTVDRIVMREEATTMEKAA
ncbi:hydrogenase maturation nickel metallochaperone HypA [Caulobacter sp. S45]|uniref:hydrogenase maturation nickel metallochaperone HypA n=1 Tax=Caulobacter sp. S45 TaxID=1641861 RepID=UPI00131A7B66|nr:hydrogenase maturation nickel metallochaperone HypA [Caulobacter sp. S45]